MSRASPVRRAGLVSRDPGASDKNTKNQVCDYMSPVSRDPGITMPGSRLTSCNIGLKDIPANLTSPALVIGP